MARKSKGKFDMKGHSIPGIKGFKGDKLKDGRHGSSALQMNSPLYQDETTKLDFDDTDVETDYDKATEKADKPLEYSGEKEGWDWAAFELLQLAKRRKAAKANAEATENKEEMNEVVDEEVDITTEPDVSVENIDTEEEEKPPQEGQLNNKT